MIYCLLHDKNNGGFITKYEDDPEYFQTMNKKGYGVYIAVNNFEATKEQMKELGVKTKRNIPFLTKFNAVYADLDIAKKGDDTTREEKEEMKDSVIYALHKKCPPSSVIRTSNGVQPIWKIDENGTDKATQLKYVNTINGIIGWSKTVGAAGDKVKDVTRVVRCPGYYHMKEEPFLCTVDRNRDNPIYKLDELYEMFKDYIEEEVVEREEFKPHVSFDPVSMEIDKLNIKEVAIRAFMASGRTASFDGKSRLILDGRLTGTFVGKNGDKNYLASTSHEPFVGNVITVVADILNINNKEARKWLMKEFNITYTKALAKDEAKSIEQPKRKIRYTWGTSSLDEKFPAIKSIMHIVLAAPTGGGKTTFAFDLAVKNAANGVKVLFVSLEMPTEELLEYKARDYAGITLEEDNNEEWRDSKEKKRKERLDYFKGLVNLELVGLDMPGEREVDFIIELMKEKQPELVLLDNLDMIADKTARTSFDRQEVVSNKLTSFSKFYKIPTLLLHHYKKSDKKGDDKGLDSFRGSGKITHNAHMAIKCVRNMDERSTPISRASFGLTCMKSRRWGQVSFCEVYWQNGTFNSSFSGEPYTPHYSDVL